MFTAKNYGGGILHAFNSLLYSIYRFICIHFYNLRWRTKNKHNLTQLVNLVDINKVFVGNYTLGCLDVRLSEEKNSYLKIGSYCCIATEVEFLGMSNHPTDWLMNERIALYMNPGIIFKLNNPKFRPCKLKPKDKKIIHKKIQEKKEKTCHGPIIVDDDVRIGTGAKIMSGVHIGQGAVIAAGAVVTKDIPPYAIAGGVPAKIIKYRFSEDKIKKLLQIDYSQTPIEKLSEVYQETIKEDFDIDFLLKKLPNKQ